MKVAFHVKATATDHAPSESLVAASSGYGSKASISQIAV
jgi:hypothetical protein